MGICFLNSGNVEGLFLGNPAEKNFQFPLQTFWGGGVLSWAAFSAPPSWDSSLWQKAEAEQDCGREGPCLLVIYKSKAPDSQHLTSYPHTSFMRFCYSATLKMEKCFCSVGAQMHANECKCMQNGKVCFFFSGRSWLAWLGRCQVRWQFSDVDTCPTDWDHLLCFPIYKKQDMYPPA